MVITEKQTKDLLTPPKIRRYAITPYIGCPMRASIAAHPL